MKIDIKEQKKLHALMDTLITNSNTFEDIQDWTEKKFGEYWKNAVLELADEGNYGWSMTYKIAIKNIFNDLKRLKNES